MKKTVARQAVEIADGAGREKWDPVFAKIDNKG